MMSNLKPYLKAIVPFVGTLVAIGVQVLVTGQFDKAEVATAVTGILASAVTYFVPNTPKE